MRERDAHGALFSIVPWPDVRSLRCLDLGAAAWTFADELRRRGAGEVVVRHDAAPGDLDPDVLGEFDLVAAGGLLTGRADAAALLDGVARVCAGVLVSVEPIDALTSVTHRGRVVVGTGGVMNGGAHRALLQRVSTRVEATSRPFVVPGQRTSGIVDRALGALLSRDVRAGALHRAFVVRVRLPGGEPLRPPADQRP
jgi:hypothetical protein